LAQHIDDGKKAPPIDIVATCTIALFAVASIKRLLDPCGRNDRRVIKRCANLRRLLGAPLMPTISSLSVRDSWEHADERLEALLRKRQRGVAISGICVSADPPSDGVVLRRFDPVGFTIHYLDDSIPLNLAVVEADLIDERIKEAWVILQREIVKLY